ncbi:hypothetical protein LN736_17380 [Clostridium sp. WLY-B-L2]|uniref:IrrE N-terminal-like domain-containing protein n=1 Tax=Clostridium aromativorans TaxID=2836848 RepID=A0ABS8N9X2_9CLOT|nr:hypothetical protein [Clostridium aromativorans]MCC9296614.1 hypothetical protein [Clostridium aromativorans]
MFKKIGDANGELNNSVEGVFDPNNVKLYFTGAPKDENRCIIANLTAALACRYIFAHELGHLTKRA